MAKEKNLKSEEVGKQETIRRMKGTGKVYHDLFKLEVASFKKNIGTARSPRLIDTEHCHFFHTFDSSGRKMEYSSSIGGHAHKITVKEVDGKLVAECGPAIKIDRAEKGEANSKEERAFTDNHIHEVLYVDSEEVEIRRRNPNALRDLDHIRTYGQNATLDHGDF